MTVSASTQRKVALALITMLLGASIIGAAKLTTEQVIFRPEYELHVQQTDTRIEAILDILCTDRPTHRRCR